ncbi:uncharacterized protein [Penaeus vannamei]|uniref:uncharacterized protein isoform X2 n=2 Tax=Penaeus vannamei TaxID=6689 RepID=UPI00387F81AF
MAGSGKRQTVYSERLATPVNRFSLSSWTKFIAVYPDMNGSLIIRDGCSIQCEGTSMQVADRSVRFAVETLRMDGVEGGGSGGGSSTGDPLATVSGEGGGGGASGGTMPAVSTVYVTIPQTATVVSAGNKGSVIQQPSQPSVIQSTALQTTALQTVQLSKGNVILLKQPSNSVIQSPGGGNLQTVQVLEAGEEQESSRKRQILARRPSYRKILNELGGGEISDKGEAGSSDSSQDEPPGTVTIGGQQYQTAGLLKGPSACCAFTLPSDNCFQIIHFLFYTYSCFKVFICFFTN